MSWIEEFGAAIRKLMDNGQCPHIPESLDMFKSGFCEYCRVYHIEKKFGKPHEVWYDEGY